MHSRVCAMQPAQASAQVVRAAGVSKRSASLDLSSVRAISGKSYAVHSRCRRATRHLRSPLNVRDEMAGQYDDNFDDVGKHLTDLFTYKAVRLVLGQLNETDPGSYRWLYDFTVDNRPSHSYQYCKLLVKSNRELGERVLLARLNLLNAWLDKLPANREKILFHVSDMNLQVLRDQLKESVNLIQTAKPRPDVDE